MALWNFLPCLSALFHLVEWLREALVDLDDPEARQIYRPHGLSPEALGERFRQDLSTLRTLNFSDDSELSLYEAR